MNDTSPTAETSTPTEGADPSSRDADVTTDRPSWWERARALLLRAGIAVFGVGFLIVVVPGMDRLLPLERVVEALGSDYVVVATIGLATIGLALLVVLVRRLRGVHEATPPVVEDILSATYPGSSFDRATAGTPERRTEATPVATYRDRLRAAAIVTVMRIEGRSRSAAAARVDDGDWTGDPAAARFLSEQFRADSVDRDASFRDVTTGAELVRRTASAILALESKGMTVGNRTIEEPGQADPDRSGPETAPGPAHEPSIRADVKPRPATDGSGGER